VVFENASAHANNQPVGSGYVRDLAAVAHDGGVPLHVDGARFFNASVALGVSPRELAAPVNTVAFCLSKGLACPVGSLVVGDRAFVARARRARKLVGGGMRQAGIVAAAGLVALADGPDGMIDRLEEDHRNARRLAEAMAAMSGIVSPGGIAQPGDGPLDPDRVRTNFILFRVERDRGEFLEALRAGNVLMVEYPHGQVRAVTHHDITGSDIEATISAVGSALASTTRRSATDPVAAGHLQGV
jgi:threonine aldolase